MRDATDHISYKSLARRYETRHVIEFCSLSAVPAVWLTPAPAADRLQNMIRSEILANVLRDRNNLNLSHFRLSASLVDKGAPILFLFSI